MEPFSTLFPLVALYPEIHYRFRALPFSLYYRRQPEIIADAPRRLEPGCALPVLLLIKEAQRFRLYLEGVRITARNGSRDVALDIPLQQRIEQPWWQRIEWLELPEDMPGIWAVDVDWQIRLGKKTLTLRNDNLPGLSHGSLQVRQSGYALPRPEGWHCGDLHVHTAYTEDQVEFGAPLTVITELGMAQGLSFAFCADHAYDLDDLPGSFHRTDPELRRFHQRTVEIDTINENYAGRFSLLPGYELTVANRRGKNVHLLLIGQRQFLPGTGDSAERWLRTRSELKIPEVLFQSDPEALAVAAHPLTEPPLLERLLLGRGRWEREDLDDERLCGMQLWNGETSKRLFRGIEKWGKSLGAGKRWKLFAGSDAHGNFNRYRQVGFPMIRLEENDRHVFGSAFTGVFLGREVSVRRLLDGLRSNPSYISDGPFAETRIVREAENSLQLEARALSTPEFGCLKEIKVIIGGGPCVQEEILLRHEPHNEFTWKHLLAIPDKTRYGRMEVSTHDGFHCFTNPEYP